MLKTVVFPPMSSLCSSFVGYWLFWVMEFRKSFQSSPAPWRLLPVGLRGSFEGHRVEAGKCQKPRRGGGCFCLECLFVCTRSAKEGCNMPRDALERMFRKEWTICCTFLLHQLHAADSGWDVIVGYIHQICAHFCETRYSNRVAPFHGLRLQVKTTQGWSQDERNQGCIPYHTQISRSAVWHTTPYMLCFLTHCVQNYTGVCVHCQKFLPYGNFYTNAVLVALSTNAALRSNPV